MESVVDKLFMHDPAWLDPGEKLVETGKEERARSVVEHGRGHVSTQQ